MFHVGQKVVCVDDSWESAPAYWSQRVPERPRRERIYRVRDILVPGTPFPADPEGLLLVEVVNPVSCWGAGVYIEGAFWSRRFRPVTERKTDISVFEEMLTRAPNEMETVGSMTRTPWSMTIRMVGVEDASE